MSKGSKIVPFRISPLLLASLDATIARVNKTKKGEPFNRSTFILTAIVEKIDHYGRNKRKSKINSKGSDQAEHDQAEHDQAEHDQAELLAQSDAIPDGQ